MISRVKTIAGISLLSLCLSPLAYANTDVNTQAKSAQSTTTQPISATTEMIAKISQGKLKVIKQFTTSIPNIQGFVVEPISGVGQQLIVYAGKQANYLMVGSMIDQNGQNLTQLYTQKYIYSAIAKKAYKDITQLTFVSQGSEGANIPKLYVFLDPNCSYCHLFFKEVEPLINDKKLQVRWIPVGIVKPDSAAKAAAILQPKDNAARLKLLTQDEKSFSMGTEEGGIKALVKTPNKPAVNQAFTKVSTNNAMFAKYFTGTPTILYINSKGAPGYFGGYLNPKQLTKLLTTVSDKW